MGEAVTRATALNNQAPPGCIYIGMEAYRAARGGFVFREVDEPIGIGEGPGLRAYELLDEGHSADHMTAAR
jgi:hypothetical protein